MTRHIDPHGGHRYAIRVHGHLDERWSTPFDGASLRHDPDGTTVIDCPAMDQAALHGQLGRIRDAGLPLISVTRLDPLPPPPTRIDPSRSTTP
jgi:hypothetical protein